MVTQLNREKCDATLQQTQARKELKYLELALVLRRLAVNFIM
jgi:hypothetical protein